MEIYTKVATPLAWYKCQNSQNAQKCSGERCEKCFWASSGVAILRKTWSGKKNSHYSFQDFKEGPVWKGKQVSLVRIHLSHPESDGKSSDVGVRVRIGILISLQEAKNHPKSGPSQRRDRILRFFLRPEIGQFSTHSGAISLQNYTENLEKLEKSVMVAWAIAKTLEGTLHLARLYRLKNTLLAGLPSSCAKEISWQTHLAP